MLISYFFEIATSGEILQRNYSTNSSQNLSDSRKVIFPQAIFLY